MAALPKFFWPLTITAGVNDRIDVTIGATPYVATIAPGTYNALAWFAGITETALVSAVMAALEAAAANNWFLSVSATGRVTIGGDAAFTIQWATGPNVARSIGPALGFAVSDDSVAATTQVGECQHQNGWYGPDPVADDTGNLPGYECAASRAIGGQTYALDFGTVYDRVLSFGFLPAHKVWKDEEGANLNEAIERLWDAGWMRFRYWADASVEATFVDLVMQPDTRKALPRNRLSPGNPLYSLQIKSWKFVAP